MKENSHEIHVLYMLHNYISKLCIIMDILLVTILSDTSHFDMLYCYPRWLITTMVSFCYTIVNLLSFVCFRFTSDDPILMQHVIHGGIQHEPNEYGFPRIRTQTTHAISNATTQTQGLILTSPSVWAGTKI